MPSPTIPDPIVMKTLPGAYQQGVQIGARQYEYNQKLEQNRKAASAAMKMMQQTGFFDESSLRGWMGDPSISRYVSPEFLTNFAGLRMKQAEHTAAMEKARRERDKDEMAYKKAKEEFEDSTLGTFVDDSMKGLRDTLRFKYPDQDGAWTSAGIAMLQDPEKAAEILEKQMGVQEATGLFNSMDEEDKNLYSSIMGAHILEARWKAGLIPRNSKTVIQMLRSGDTAQAVFALPPAQQVAILEQVESARARFFQENKFHMPDVVAEALTRGILKERLLPGWGTGRYSMLGEQPSSMQATERDVLATWEEWKQGSGGAVTSDVPPASEVVPPTETPPLSEPSFTPGSMPLDPNWPANAGQAPGIHPTVHTETTGPPVPGQAGGGRPLYPRPGGRVSGAVMGGHTPEPSKAVEHITSHGGKVEEAIEQFMRFTPPPKKWESAKDQMDYLESALKETLEGFLDREVSPDYVKQTLEDRRTSVLMRQKARQAREFWHKTAGNDLPEGAVNPFQRGGPSKRKAGDIKQDARSRWDEIFDTWSAGQVGPLPRGEAVRDNLTTPTYLDPTGELGHDEMWKAKEGPYGPLQMPSGSRFERAQDAAGIRGLSFDQVQEGTRVEYGAKLMQAGIPDHLREPLIQLLLERGTDIFNMDPDQARTLLKVLHTRHKPVNLQNPYPVAPTAGR